jgi:transcriptional regulator with XRE-family HTH domain
MSALGKYISTRRIALGMSIRQLAIESGISHTEISRIELGERECPSIRVLISVAKVLGVDYLELVQLVSDDNLSPICRNSTKSTFPHLQNESQVEFIENVADLIHRYESLPEEKYDKLLEQVEMFLEYNTKLSY